MEFSISPSLIIPLGIAFALYFFGFFIVFYYLNKSERKYKTLTTTLANVDHLCIHLQQDIHEASYLTQLGGTAKEVVAVLMRHQFNTEPRTK